MKAVKITEKVWWVGAIDWGLKEFHGYTTHRGSTYNAFLVLADKITLIDTVKAPFKQEMYSRIESVIGDITKIDIIVSDHAEMDHSGALPEVIKEVKPSAVYASTMGVKALDAHFRIADKLTAVKTGDSGSGQYAAPVRGNSYAPLAGQYVRLSHRRKSPLLSGWFRDASRYRKNLGRRKLLAGYGTGNGKILCQYPASLCTPGDQTAGSIPQPQSGY
jgi:hypothetical protein